MRELLAYPVCSVVPQNEPVVDEEGRRRRWREALEVDLVPEQTSDDRDDGGWGDRQSTDKKSAAPDPDVQRYLDEKPPHH